MPRPCSVSVFGEVFTCRGCKVLCGCVGAVWLCGLVGRLYHAATVDVDCSQSACTDMLLSLGALHAGMCWLAEDGVCVCVCARAEQVVHGVRACMHL